SQELLTISATSIVAPLVASSGTLNSSIMIPPLAFGTSRDKSEIDFIAWQSKTYSRPKIAFSDEGKRVVLRGGDRSNGSWNDEVTADDDLLASNGTSHPVGCDVM
ncbi:hypothetical protein ACFWCQ_14945, partial [Streptomyces cyaneofuscatus]|uniref:hypothetical protein n=1 Tax=Streptomyces cyaneofuscatus TaxID=66883 RepID=UPI003646DD1D